MFETLQYFFQHVHLSVEVLCILLYAYLYILKFHIYSLYLYSVSFKNKKIESYSIVNRYEVCTLVILIIVT